MGDYGAAVADLRKALGTPPLTQNFFIFMQFLGEIWDKLVK